MAPLQLGDLGDRRPRPRGRRWRRSRTAGPTSARRTIATPVASSPVRPRPPSSSAAACTSAAPPPGTMPSSTAARVADTASSMRCLRSLSAVSVAAPTLMTATPPESLASRSCSFSRSQSESVASISRLELRDARLDGVLGAAALDEGGGVLGDHGAAHPAQQVQPGLGQLEPDLRVDHRAAGGDGQVVHERLAAVTEERRLDRGDPDGLADRVDDQGGQRLALDVLGDDQQRLAVGEHLLQQREQVGDAR